MNTTTVSHGLFTTTITTVSQIKLINRYDTHTRASTFLSLRGKIVLALSVIMILAAFFGILFN